MPLNRGWFRVYDRHLESPQIIELNLAERGLLMGIWTLASASDGVIHLSARLLRRRLFIEEWTEHQVQEALDKLKALDLLEDVEGGFAPSRWIEHQFPNVSDRPESVAERKRKQRSRQNQGDKTVANDNASASHADVTTMSHQVTSQNRTETETEQNREDIEQRQNRTEQIATPIPTEPDQVSVPSVPSFGTGASVPSPEPVRQQPARHHPDWHLTEADIRDLLKSKWTREQIEWGVQIGIESGTKPRNAKSVLHASILPDVVEGKRPMSCTANAPPSVKQVPTTTPTALSAEARATLEAEVAKRKRITDAVRAMNPPQGGQPDHAAR
jgi:hypothetical protein